MHIPTDKVGLGQVLVHVSRVAFKGTALYFGTDASNRFDAPDGRYGTLYLAWDIPTALMESVFRRHTWALFPYTAGPQKREVTLAEIKKRSVRRIVVAEDLQLADLTVAGVMASQFGANLSQAVDRDYGLTQAISACVHGLSASNGSPFDGLIYPSRNNPGARCICLFDRATRKLTDPVDTQLNEVPEWKDFVLQFSIGVRL